MINDRFDVAAGRLILLLANSDVLRRAMENSADDSAERARITAAFLRREFSGAADSPLPGSGEPIVQPGAPHYNRA